MKDIIKNPELLKESNRDFDFFDFEKYTKSLLKSLKAYSSPTVTTLIGGYGTGKSVLLNEVRKLSLQSKAKPPAKWVFFECWQYPDKRDLWEALILELVEQIDGKKKRDEMLRSYSDISTWRDSLAGYLHNTGAAIATILGITAVMWLTLSTADDNIRNLLISLATGFILVLIASIEFLAKPESKSAVSRLSDYKAELETTLENHKGTLYIVLEDVDRAGELGRRFFETVSHFIKDEMFLKNDIKVVVPIADIDDSKNKALRDSIDKASDNILHFNPRYNADGFIGQVFTENFLDEPTRQMLSATINPYLGRNVSVRKMKHILRNAIVKYQRLRGEEFDADLAICIAVEFSKYMNGSYGGSTLYSQAANSYEHKPLFEWASRKQLLNREPDDPETTEVKLRNHFKKSDEIFSGVKYEDSTSDMRRGAHNIVNRVFLLSRAYFDDL